MALTEKNKLEVTVVERKLFPPLDNHQAVSDTAFKPQKGKPLLMKMNLEIGENFLLIISYMVFWPKMPKIEVASSDVHPDTTLI